MAESRIRIGRMHHISHLQRGWGLHRETFRRATIHRFIYQCKCSFLPKFASTCCILIIFQVPVFVILILGYKLRRHGLKILDWGPERSNDLRNTVQVASETRRGRLEFPDGASARENFWILVNWVWVWMK